MFRIGWAKGNSLSSPWFQGLIQAFTVHLGYSNFQPVGIKATVQVKTEGPLWGFM